MRISIFQLGCIHSETRNFFHGVMETNVKKSKQGHPERLLCTISRNLHLIVDDVIDSYKKQKIANSKIFTATR